MHSKIYFITTNINPPVKILTPYAIAPQIMVTFVLNPLATPVTHVSGVARGSTFTSALYEKAQAPRCDVQRKHAALCEYLRSMSTHAAPSHTMYCQIERPVAPTPSENGVSEMMSGMGHAYA